MKKLLAVLILGFIFISCGEDVTEEIKIEETELQDGDDLFLRKRPGRAK
ncbi:MAG: hypothetical protein AAF616_14290 [Bacteroidota bacterium]